jgi:hypothetical protein
MTPIEISFTVEPSISPCDFLLEFLVDDQVLWSTQAPWQAHTVQITMDDSTATESHTLAFRMQGKTWQHTVLDDDAGIVEDHVVHVRDLKIEGVLIQSVFESQAVYSHDFNGTGCWVQDQFFGIMGCNGTLSMPFTTPIFLWLLENA